MISLAFFATLVNYLDRQALSVAAPILRIQFHMSSIGYSRVLFAFMLAYTIMNGASGLLIDRLGTKLGYGLFVAWWSLCDLLQVFARGAGSLGVFRFLIGMGEAGNWPGAVKVVAEWFPPEERSLASGIFNSGSAAGAILAPPLIAGLVLRFGWRSAFIAVGTLGFVWVIAWAAIYRSPAQKIDVLAPPAPPLRALLRSRFVWTFTVSKVFIDPVWYFYTFWFPQYLFQARHFGLASIGRYAWIPFFVAGLGSLGGGFIAKGFLLARMPVSAARKAAVTVAAAMMAMAIPAVLVQSSALSIAFVSVAMAGYTAALANMLAMPADVFPAVGVASVYGLASMGSGFGGMVFALVTGWLVDRYSYVPVFWLFGLIPLICVSILWALMGRLEPDSNFLKEPITSPV
ncbi:MAG: MFS transporter [Terracidiphilus sp.]|jgi:ACS family hexuronate transporter-like MFS transporter